MNVFSTGLEKLPLRRVQSEAIILKIVPLLVRPQQITRVRRPLLTASFQKLSTIPSRSIQRVNLVSCAVVDRPVENVELFPIMDENTR